MVNDISRKWVVHLIAQAPVGEPEPPPDDKRLATFANLVTQTYQATADGSGSAVEVRMPVDDPAVHTADEAAHYAQILVDTALENVGLKGWEIGPGEVVPELIGVTEVSELLGITRQRLHDLRRLPGRFPTPSSELSSGPVWTRSAIEAYSAAWNRRPGRPAMPCAGMPMRHLDGTLTCVRCTAEGRDLTRDEVVHPTGARQCGGCPVCMAQADCR